MSQFYSSIRGGRGEATRCGSKRSGITGHIRGWGSGVLVTGDHVDGKDVFHIYKTHGSSGGPAMWLGKVTISKAGNCVFIPASGRNRRPE